MSQQDILEQMLRDIAELKRQVNHLGGNVPLYTILNLKTSQDVLTSDQNNYALGNYDFIFLNTAANRIINGISNGVTGRVLYLYNNSSFNFTFTNQSASASAENQIFTGSSLSVVVWTRKCAFFVYSFEANWKLIYPIA